MKCLILTGSFIYFINYSSLCIPIIFVVGFVVRLVEFSVKFFKLAKGAQKLIGPFVAVPFVFCYSVYYMCSSLYLVFCQKCFMKFDTLAKDKFLNVKHGVKYFTARDEHEKKIRENKKFEKNEASSNLLNSSKAMKLNVQRVCLFASVSFNFLRCKADFAQLRSRYCVVCFCFQP